MPILTERLRLRRVRPGDAPRVAALMGDWDVAKQTGGIPFPYSEAAARDWIAREALDWANGFGCALALEDRDTGLFLGALSFKIHRSRLGQRHAELGYWLGRPYWGCGFAGEAVAAALTWFCDLAEIKRVEAVTFSDNAASIGVLIRQGFRLARVTTRHYPVRGGRRRVNIFHWSPDEKSSWPSLGTWIRTPPADADACADAVPFERAPAEPPARPPVV